MGGERFEYDIICIIFIWFTFNWIYERVNYRVSNRGGI